MKIKVTRLKVDGREMFVCESTDDKVNITEKSPHVHYCLERSDQRVELAAFKRVAKRIGPVGSVIDLFGGSGWHSSVIQAVNEPAKHLVLDYDADCVKSIKRSLPDIPCVRVDSYKAVERLETDSWDWVHADFNEFTHKRNEQGQYGAALEHIFRASRQYATVTDSAIFGIARFKKNRQSYHDSIGMDPECWQDYYRAMSKWYNKHFGFAITYVIAWHRMAAMCVLEKGAKVKSKIKVHEEKEKAPFEVLEVSWENE